MVKRWLCVMEEPIAETWHAVQATPKLAVACPWSAKGVLEPWRRWRLGGVRRQALEKERESSTVTQLELDKGSTAVRRS
jgi:hypothetical protein